MKKFFLFILLSIHFSSAEEALDSKILLNFFDGKTSQKGMLIITPTDESSNEVITQYADAQIKIEEQSFKLEVKLKNQKKNILISYDAANGYKEEWQEGKKISILKNSRVADFYLKLFQKDIKGLMDFYNINQRAILDDEGILLSNRFELTPKINTFPKVVILLSASGKKVFMMSMSHNGQSFVWSDKDYNP